MNANLAFPGIIFRGNPVSLPQVVAVGSHLLASRSGHYASGRGTVEIRAGSEEGTRGTHDDRYGSPKLTPFPRSKSQDVPGHFPW